MRRVVLATVLLAALTGGGGAAADDFSGGSFVVLFGPADHPVQSWDMNATFEGTVTVRFSGSFGSGQTVWTPGPSAQLSAAKVRTGKRTRYTAFLASTGTHGVTARVDRPGGMCTDVQSNVFDQAAVKDRSDGVLIGLAGPTPALGGYRMAETRCGGPLADDIGRALPMVKVSAAKLRKGGFDIDFRGSAPLSTPGMIGTVESSVVVHVATRASTRQPRVSREKPKRYRRIEVTYAVAEVSGSIPAMLRGGGELCRELDSCGADEATMISLAGSPAGSATMTAIAPARRSVRDLRAAAGLSPGDPARIDAFGSGTVRTADAGFSATLSRDGQPACQDKRRVAPFNLQLQRNGARVTVQLMPASVIRTVCPGPALADGYLGPALATTSIPLSDFGKSRVRLHLTKGSSIDIDGWSGTTQPDVTITLVRQSVKTRRFSA